MKTKQTPITLNLRQALRLVTLLAAISIGLFTQAIVAQENLKQNAEAAGTDWIIGQWTATTDEGGKIDAEFKWELNGYMVMITFKMDDYLLRGMIFHDADKVQVVEVGADNQGGSVTGTWSVEDDKLVSRTKRILPNGDSMRVANFHSRVDSQTMTVAPHLIDAEGKMADEPWATLVFKRKLTE